MRKLGVKGYNTKYKMDGKLFNEGYIILQFKGQDIEFKVIQIKNE